MSTWRFRLGEAEGLTVTLVITASGPGRQQELDTVGERVSARIEDGRQMARQALVGSPALRTNNRGSSGAGAGGRISTVQMASDAAEFREALARELASRPAAGPPSAGGAGGQLSGASAAPPPTVAPAREPEPVATAERGRRTDAPPVNPAPQAGPAHRVSERSRSRSR